MENDNMGVNNVVKISAKNSLLIESRKGFVTLLYVDTNESDFLLFTRLSADCVMNFEK